MPGFQLQLTVTAGSVPLTAWTAGFSLADASDTIASSWSATVSKSGAQVTAVNASYNGSIPAGGSQTFGMVVNGASSTLSGLTCAP